MGLDIDFYKVKKESVGYFRKVNFILTYFEVESDQDCEDIPVSKDKLAEFVADLKCELMLYNERKPKDNPDEDAELEPINQKLRTKEVCFGGSTAYYPNYWEDVKEVYTWAKGQLESFDWDNYTMILNCNW
jgi:hypothetical protein